MYCRHSSTCVKNGFCANPNADNCKLKEQPITDEDWTKLKLSLFKQEPKMTREEAVKKLECRLSTSSREFVSALEALDLIKFDEPKSTMPEAIQMARMVTNGSASNQDDFISVLNKYGYGIVKKP